MNINERDRARRVYNFLAHQAAQLNANPKASDVVRLMAECQAYGAAHLMQQLGVAGATESADKHHQSAMFFKERIDIALAAPDLLAAQAQLDQAEPAALVPQLDTRGTSGG